MMSPVGDLLQHFPTLCAPPKFPCCPIIYTIQEVKFISFLVLRTILGVLKSHQFVLILIRRGRKTYDDQLLTRNMSHRSIQFHETLQWSGL
jgi:hypothetical protein